MQFDKFPEDDAFYAVKWIDRFAPTASRSVTMSVDVVLQRLPQTDLRDIQWLSRKQVGELLGKPRADAPAPVDPKDAYNQKRWPSLTRRCHAGLLPFVHIGDVFHKRQPVGRLPQGQFPLVLDRGSASGVSYTLRQEIAGPGWRNIDRPRTVLGRYQYELPWRAMERSQVLVVKHDDTEFIVPHNVIFRGFYAVNTALARAFTEGPWEMTRHTVIRPEGLMMGNGLCTLREPEDRFWTVILRRGVQLDCERIAAILYHDPHAKAHANAIYTLAEQSRRESRDLARDQRWVNPLEWYVSAQVPLGQGRLRLKVHGLPLREGTLQDGSALRQILVTRIVSCNEPLHIPPIQYELENSGETSANPTVSDEPKPYSHNPSDDDTPLPTRQDTTVASEQDADARGRVHRVDGGEFACEDAKEMKKMTKASSKHYTGGGGRREPRPPTGVVSAGFRMPGAARDVDPFIVETVVPAPNRLRLIWSAFERLQEAHKILAFQAIPPSDPGARAPRGVFECWNFLDADERAEVVKRPTRCWRVIERKGGWPRLRAVLVCEVRHENGTCLWFEIECRPTEKFRSLLIGPVSDLSDALIYDCLSKIAEVKGHRLAESVAAAAAAHGVLAANYVHILRSDQAVNAQEGDGADARQLNDGSVLKAIVKVLGGE